MKILNYRVGDTVQIKHDLKIGTYYSKNNTTNEFCNDMMMSYGNTVAKIVRVTPDFKYRITCDLGQFSWIDSMFKDFIYYKEI